MHPAAPCPSRPAGHLERPALRLRDLTEAFFVEAVDKVRQPHEGQSRLCLEGAGREDLNLASLRQL
jgi:hypothetical protein